MSTESSFTRRRKLRGSLAQLVSKFEVLDSVSTVEQSTPRNDNSRTSWPSFCSSYTAPERSHPERQGSPIQGPIATNRNRHNTVGPSYVPDWNQISPRHIPSPKPSKTTSGSLTPVAPLIDASISKGPKIPTRHKSVAERRRIFEEKAGASNGKYFTISPAMPP